MAIPPLHYRLSLARALSQQLDSQIKSVNSHTETYITLTAADVGADASGSAEQVRTALINMLASYVLTTTFNQVVSNLQTSIDGKQPLGDYALNNTLANYVLTTAFNQAIASLQASINTKQASGDYALNNTLANYVLTTAFNQTVASLQASINGKQDAGSYALQASLANYVLTSTYSAQVASLQTSIAGKQDAGSYVLTSQVKLLLTANLTLYVSNTGDDTTGKGTSALPFKTVAKAASYIKASVEQAGYTVTIQIVDSATSYAISISGLKDVTINGNATTPANVTISSVSIDGCSGIVLSAMEFLMSAGGNGILSITNYSRVSISNCLFDGTNNGVSGTEIVISTMCYVTLTSFTIKGGGGYFIIAQFNCRVTLSSFSVINSPNYASAFVSVTDNSELNINNAPTVTGTITGSKGNITKNGVITGATSNLPATMSAVVTGTGGQSV